MSAIRKPPKPPGWDLPKGRCRFCADEIREDNGTRLVLMTKKRWHAWPEHSCQHLWAIANDPAYARIQVWLRDFGICAGCGADTKVKAPAKDVSWDEVREDLAQVKPNGASGWSSVSLGAWDVEHTLPLWLADREAPDALRFWLLGNLTTYCKPCHSQKTAREASNRAKIARIQESGGMLKKKRSAKEKFLAKRAIRD